MLLAAITAITPKTTTATGVGVGAGLGAGVAVGVETGVGGAFMGVAVVEAATYTLSGRVGGRVMDTGQDMIDIGTAAIRMGVTPEAVRKRISRGTIPATKQDGRSGR